jgi:hypothetical protein
MIVEYTTQSTLNPKLWDDDHLKPKLREKFLKIAKAFADFLLPIIDVEVRDVTLTGSNANYNWTDKSDIDLHVLINYKDIKAYDANSALVREYLMAKKSIWNNNYPLTFKGMQIELYAQDTNEPHASTGVYSIMKNKWIYTPNPQQISVEDDAIDKKAEPYEYEIDKLKSGMPDLLSRIKRLKSRLKTMRQTALAVEGEFSVENLAFKKLRNTGHLARLNQLAKLETMSQLQVESHGNDSLNNKISGELALHVRGDKKLNKNDWHIIGKQLDAKEDPHGQWKHPNQCTMIPSNNITMKNVGYPVLGIDDTGYKQVMHPEQNYTYPGSQVFEIPMTSKWQPMLMQLNNYIKNGLDYEK